MRQRRARCGGQGSWAGEDFPERGGPRGGVRRGTRSRGGTLAGGRAAPGAGDAEQVHVAALGAVVSRHTQSMRDVGLDVNISDQNYGYYGRTGLAGWRTRWHRLATGRSGDQEGVAAALGPALALQPACSGYLPCMARPRLPDSARVPIGLEVSETDAARIDEVLGRPEFAGWTRSEWCREIIRTALRYYTGDAPAADRRQAHPAEVSAAAQAASPTQPAAVMAATVPVPAAGTSGPAAPPGGTEPVEPPAHEPPAQPECAHPADARDYETGTCAACGAVLWD
jgi:hypothetical protein